MASSLVTETTNSQIKFGDRAGVSAAELMIETATGLSQKLNAKLSELRERQKGVGKKLRKVPPPTKSQD